MIEVPHAIRSVVIESMSEFLETADNSLDSDAVAEALVEALESAAAEVGTMDEDLVALIDSETDSNAGLMEVLSDAIADSDESMNSGEEMLALLERLVEIDWLNAGDESDGFFTSGDDDTDDDY